MSTKHHQITYKYLRGSEWKPFRLCKDQYIQLFCVMRGLFIVAIEKLSGIPLLIRELRYCYWNTYIRYSLNEFACKLIKNNV